ncbi:ATPase [Streptomyces sp. N2-109]|uniref:ATPase n=1 Tax=Streptomyces gossypii TaxID=2883101 RepID=A0ABT2JRI3_9ACTN|nr:BadF/BadG/BcrA/BcrD ATPase family protein [Streptomyces gossypii]MCT2590495.1 ATPase [Streptomyces gossypii]
MNDTADGRTTGGRSPGEAFLAVDAGNSKTDVAVVAADGAVLGTARGGGFQPPVVGVETALDDLELTIARAARAAGTEPPFALVSACLANADLPREEREVTAAVGRRGWGRATHVANDTFAVLRAGLPDDGSVRRGVAVVCGAGVNCVGRADDGRVHRFPALGRLSGDWGGGGGLSDEALWHAARAEDGRGECTELARALPAYFGLPTMYALIEGLHLGDVPVTRKHELAPLLFEVAAAGDPVARALVHRQADEIVALAAVTLTRLGLLAHATPVLLGGSVLAARHPMLHDRLTEGLADRAPRATARLVSAPPVLGAGLLALDELRAAEGAYARLREQCDTAGA